MSLGKILREKREKLELTLDEVSSRVGFSKPYLSTIETGRVNNPPSDELLLKLEKVLEFEPGQLLHIAHIEGMPSDVKEELETSQAQNKKFRRVLRELMEEKTEVKQLGKLFEEGVLAAEGSSLPLSAGRLVPIINKVPAGYPADFNDLEYPVGIADDYVRCPDLHDPHAFAVRVVGDSMEPNFKEGDIVVFSPAVEPKSGDDCFIRFSSPHETMFKRVFFEDNGMVRLQPRNDKYPPVIVDGKRINGMYRAVAKVERL